PSAILAKAICASAWPTRLKTSRRRSIGWVFGLTRIFSDMSVARTYDFVQLDVFTKTPLQGNALAIFPDAREIGDVEMQALAKEMNLSETVYIFPRDAATESQEGKRARIFTVA